MSSLRFRIALCVFGAYLLLAQVILPLLSPLRALGEIEPGEIRNLLLPPLFIAMLFSFGIGRLLKAKTLLHVALGLAFFQAMIVGVPNLLDSNSQRGYISHLFQVASAYLMLGVGWLAADRIEHRFWKVFVALALAATLVSTFFTISALGRGDIGRLYTPAYGFIFVAAYSSLYSKSNLALTFGGILLSNKRGPILAVALIFALSQWNSLMSAGASREGGLARRLIYAFGIISVATVATMMIVSWASAPGNEYTPVGRAVNITYGRLVDMTQVGESERSLNDISSGRFEEIDAALNSLDDIDYLLGSGAGWSISLLDGKIVQNIHFSPLSLISVFGVPFAIFLYGYLIYLVIRGIRLRGNIGGLSTTERMAPLYLSGALLHSMFAYSLFIDWLVFFFAGVISKSLKTRASRSGGGRSNEKNFSLSVWLLGYLHVGPC